MRRSLQGWDDVNGPSGRVVGWKDMASVQQSFKDLGFHEATLKDKGVLVMLDKSNKTLLKVMESKKLRINRNFEGNVRYHLLVDGFAEFMFVKKDTSLSENARYLTFRFRKDSMTAGVRHVLDNSLVPNDTPKFDRMFEGYEIDVHVADLKGILNGGVGSLSPEAIKSLGSSMKLNIGTKKAEQKSREVENAKRAMLVVASAGLFHARLGGHLAKMSKPDIDNYTKKAYSGDWPPASLRDCYNSDDVRASLLGAWRDILAVDYRPIFETGITLLESADGPDFVKFVKGVVGWSLHTIRHTSGLKHDILGRLFHKLLPDAKQDGSYYTSVPAAILLAGMAISGKDMLPKPLKGMKVIDPACGTGTLLMAASERISEVAGGRNAPLALVENVIHGADINTTACHMAATTLALLSPATDFAKMNIFVAMFGRDEKSKYRAGSLEMYAEDGLLPYVNWTGTAVRQVESGQSRQESWHHKFDLVIMNPPFTRNSLRHDQFSEKDEKGVKEREERLYKGFKGIRHSSSSMFILLGEKLAKEEGSTLAFVCPQAMASGPGALNIRQFLAEKFHIESIVISSDPDRVYFSENTKINEILVIAKRDGKKEKPPTNVVKLTINPSGKFEAEELLKILSEKSRSKYHIIDKCPRDIIAKGDWSFTQFHSSRLVELFYQIQNGELFDARRLGDVCMKSVAPQQIRALFVKSDTQTTHTPMLTIWTHKTSEITSIHNEPVHYLAKHEKSTSKDWPLSAENYWGRAGFLHVGEKIRLNLVKAFSICTDKRMLGQTWHTFIPIIIAEFRRLCRRHCYHTFS